MRHGEQIAFIMGCVFDACELFNDEYDAIEKELKNMKKLLTSKHGYDILSTR